MMSHHSHRKVTYMGMRMTLCRDNKIPLIVFGIDEPENMIKIVKGEKIGTYIQ